MKKNYLQWVKRFLLVCILLQFSLNNIIKSEEKLFGRINLPLGKVMVLSENNSQWKKARFNQEVFNTEKIKTLNKSRCEIKIDAKQILRIGENAIIQLEDPLSGANGILVESGQAWLNARPGGKKIKVRTPTAVAAIRGTIYRLNCTDNHSTFNVYDGSVEVTPLKEDGITPEDTSFSVIEGQSLTLVKDFDKYKKEQKKAAQDFQISQKRDFSSFMKKQSDGYRGFKSDQLEGFSKFKSGHFIQQRIDIKADKTSDWVR